LKRILILTTIFIYIFNTICYAENSADTYGKTLTHIIDKTAVNNNFIFDANTDNYSFSAEIDMKDFKEKENSSFPFLYFSCESTSDGYALFINSVKSVISIYLITEGNNTWLKNIPYLLSDTKPLKIKADIFENGINIFTANDSYSYFQRPTISLERNITGTKIIFQKPTACNTMTINNFWVRELISPADYTKTKSPQKLIEEYTNPFEYWTDCENHQFGGAIRFLSSKGIVNGKFTNKFCPDMPIKVSEFLKIYLCARNIPVKENISDWAKPYITTAITEGIIAEDSFNDFNSFLTKEKAAEIIDIPCTDSNPKEFLTRGEAALWIASLLDSSYNIDKDLATASFVEYEQAFSNPMKGLRGTTTDTSENKNPLITLMICNIPWNKIEDSENDDVYKLIRYANANWSQYPDKNIKIIPQVVLHFNEGTYWPWGMTEFDYTSSQFQTRLKGLIKKMGEAWDNDSRIAFVRMGIIGKWGEMQDPYPSLAVRKILSDSFSSAFKNKLVQVNILLSNSNLNNGKVGWSWDSFGHWDNLNILDRTAEVSWTEYPSGGEAAFDWGNTLGTDPDDALLNFGDRYYELIRYSHFTYLGWISKYNRSNAQISKNAEKLHKALGYRYFITDASYTASAKAGENAKLNLHITNRGSAPFYYNWPVQIALLDKNTHQVVWCKNDNSCDIRTWIPSDNYSEEIIHTANIEFTVPDISDGEYILAVSVAEPGGTYPSLRFANKNYYQGGYTPLGIFCISEENNAPHVTGEFDDLQSETLKYKL